MKRLSKIAAIVALVVPSTAIGATVDQTVTFGGANAFADDFFSTFTQYNGPETLTGVELIYDYNSSGTVSADLCAFYSDCEPAIADIGLQGAGVFAGLSVSDTDGTGINNSTDAIQFGAFGLSLNGSLTGFTLSDFVGNGFVAGSIGADGGYAGFANVFGASHNGEIILRYTTEIAPVPVPASLGFAMIGMAGLGAVGLRRKSKG